MIDPSLFQHTTGLDQILVSLLLFKPGDKQNPSGRRSMLAGMEGFGVHSAMDDPTAPRDIPTAFTLQIIDIVRRYRDDPLAALQAVAQIATPAEPQIEGVDGARQRDSDQTAKQDSRRE
jgi:hypothetical protein